MPQPERRLWVRSCHSTSRALDGCRRSKAVDSQVVNLRTRARSFRQTERSRRNVLPPHWPKAAGHMLCARVLAIAPKGTIERVDLKSPKFQIRIAKGLREDYPRGGFPDGSGECVRLFAWLGQQPRSAVYDRTCPGRGQIELNDESIARTPAPGR